MARTASVRTRRQGLPPRLRPLFWEYDFVALSWDQDRDLVIDRILTAGSWEALAWLRARLGDRALRRWIECRRGARLNPRQLRFWQLILGLRSRQVDTWVAARRETLWERRRAP